MKKLSKGFKLTGRLPSIFERQSVYVCISVSSSFGVNGFRMLLVMGNIEVGLELYFEVLAPNPKIGRLVTLASDEAINFIISL